MLKASALYIAIIIAAIVAILSASLIATAYFYRWEQQKNQRWQKLSANLQCGISLSLSSAFSHTDSLINIDLFGEGTDSLAVKKEKYGIFDYSAVAAFQHEDTLKKAFLIAPDDRQDQLAIYLSDEDRPVSVSGTTQITGNVALPKSGIKQAYVEGKPYKGGKKLVNGNIGTSNRTLPELNPEQLKALEEMLDDTLITQELPTEDLSNSFFKGTQVLRINAERAIIDNNIRGNIILLCDTVLTISATAKLQDVIVYARGIVVENGFSGSCQLFARDSVITGDKVHFNYPSAIGVVKKRAEKQQSRIVLGKQCVFEGILFSYEPERSSLQTLIALGENSIVKGEIYATGLLKMERPVTVEGKVSCNRFIIQTSTTLYENYLIDIRIDRPARSKYYLSSGLFDKEETNNQVLKWLD